MGSLVRSDACGKMQWDTKASRAGAALAPVVSKWAPGLGTAPACLQLAWLGTGTDWGVGHPCSGL